MVNKYRKFGLNLKKGRWGGGGGKGFEFDRISLLLLAAFLFGNDKTLRQELY